MNIFNNKHVSVLKIFYSKLHLSKNLDSGKIWRQKNKLPKLQTALAALNDQPDYSFLGNFKIYLLDLI